MLNSMYSWRVWRLFTAERKAFAASEKSSGVFWLLFVEWCIVTPNLCFHLLMCWPDARKFPSCKLCTILTASSREVCWLQLSDSKNSKRAVVNENLKSSDHKRGCLERWGCLIGILRHLRATFLRYEAILITWQIGLLGIETSCVKAISHIFLYSMALW